MKKIGKMYKRIVIILGILCSLGSIYIAHEKTSSIISLYDSNIRVITFFRMILILGLLIFTVCLLLYGIGVIIEILLSINDNISNLSLKYKEDILNDKINNDDKNDYNKEFEYNELEYFRNNNTRP